MRRAEAPLYAKMDSAVVEIHDAVKKPGSAWKRIWSYLLVHLALAVVASLVAYQALQRKSG